MSVSVVIDSVRQASKQDYRQGQGCQSTMSTGRLHKGHGIVAASASIPSKYQTIVLNNAEKKGFSSGAKRFQYDCGQMTDTPCPMQYQGVSTMVKDSPSLSKKGSGGFVSRAQRFPRVKEEDITMGPGQYNPLTRSEHLFNKAACTRIFHQPIAIKNEDKKQFSTPAPNHYNISNKVTGRVAYDNNVAACAAFKSRLKRELITNKSNTDVPAPCTYTINDRLTSYNPRETTAPFKSTTNRQMLNGLNYTPGPGTYHPFEPVEKPNRKLLPRKHYLCISAPAIPLPPSPVPPGPGHYNLVDYQGQPHKFVSGSAFVSTTSRLLGDIKVVDKQKPGPATYNPHHIGRQSFMYNAKQKWI